MRPNIVLIDLESVQPASLGLLAPEYFRVKVFVGATQSKLSFELAAAVQQMGNRAEYIKIAGVGKNALDFHIAYYIGRIATEQPESFFHIISKDTGFDPLIQHLKDENIFCGRWEGIEDIPAVKAAQVKSPEERAILFMSRLLQPNATRPRTEKTLLISSTDEDCRGAPPASRRRLVPCGNSRKPPSVQAPDQAWPCDRSRQAQRRCGSRHPEQHPEASRAEVRL